MSPETWLLWQGYKKPTAEASNHLYMKINAKESIDIMHDDDDDDDDSLANHFTVVLLLMFLICLVCYIMIPNDELWWLQKLKKEKVISFLTVNQQSIIWEEYDCVFVNIHCNEATLNIQCLPGSGGIPEGCIKGRV